MIILPIKRVWFDLIASGVKKEEYREVKMYWRRRIANKFRDESVQKWVMLRAGYRRDSPVLFVLCSFRKGTGRPEWGAVKGVEYYVLIIHQVACRHIKMLYSDGGFRCGLFDAYVMEDVCGGLLFGECDLEFRRLLRAQGAEEKV